MKPELKPCPFCGGEPEYITGKTHGFVRCKNLMCGCAGPAMPISDTYAAMPEAIKKWNTRHVPKSELEFDYESEDV